LGDAGAVGLGGRGDALKLSADANLRVPLALDWRSSVPIEAFKDSFCPVKGKQHR